MSADHRTLAEIEEDIARNRADLERGLLALQRRLSLEGMLGGANALLGVTAADMSQVVAKAVRSNPLACAVTAVGLVWLVSGRGRPRLHPGHDNRRQERRPSWFETAE